jgi:hypothetical protein
MMSRSAVDEYADAYELELICADGFDDCIIGIAQQFNNVFVVYDRQKVIRVLMERDGMTDEDADEFFEFNIVGAWVGDNTPAFLWMAD